MYDWRSGLAAVRREMAIPIAPDTTILDVFRSMLTCMDCEQWPREQIRVCIKGCGVLCHRCSFLPVHRCTKCNSADFTEVKFVSNLSAKIHSLALVPCPNAKRGCQEWYEGPDIEGHEEVCLFSPMPCISATCGHTVDRGAFAAHLLTHTNSGNGAPNAEVRTCAIPLYPIEVGQYCIKYEVKVATNKAHVERMKRMEERRQVHFPPYLLMGGISPPPKHVKVIDHPVPTEIYIITTSKDQDGLWKITAWGTRKSEINQKEVVIRVRGGNNSQISYRGEINLHSADSKLQPNGLFIPPITSSFLVSNGEEEIFHFQLEVEIHSASLDSRIRELEVAKYGNEATCVI